MERIAMLERRFASLATESLTINPKKIHFITEGKRRTKKELSMLSRAYKLINRHF